MMPVGQHAKNGFAAIYRREVLAYWHTPSAYLVMGVFAFLTGLFAFHVSGFFELRAADLNAFFSYHPWLYCVLAPALTMRSWADETRQGTLETLLTLPVSTIQLVAAKHCAAWTMLGIALLLTLPMWCTVNYLGKPDNGVIAVSFLVSFLTAGAYLAIGQACSVITGHQPVAFLLSLLIGLALTAAGTPLLQTLVSNLGGTFAAEQVGRFGIALRLDTIWRGVIDVETLCFLLGLTALWLATAALFVSAKRGG